MHVLHKCVCEKIDEVVCCGISPRNIEYLGMLVDIRKDIEEIWHWREDSGDIKIENGEAKTDVMSLVKDVEYLNRVMKSSNVTEDHKKRMHYDIMELLSFADSMKRVIDEAKLDPELMDAARRVFK